jgi:hypothetical protein
MSSVTKQLNMNITSTRTEVRPTKLAEKTLLLPKRPLQPVARQKLPRMSNESWFVACRQPACKGVRQSPWRETFPFVWPSTFNKTASKRNLRSTRMGRVPS